MTFKFPLPGTKEDWTVTYDFNLSQSHYGIDWSCYKKGNTIAQPIYASADGTIVKSCYGDDYVNGVATTTAGYIVEIDHGKDLDGCYYGTRYQHMNAPSHLKVGATVKAGDVVGYVGGSGTGGPNNGGKTPSYGAHLHFEILKYNSKITGFSGQRGNVNPKNYIYNTQSNATTTATVKKYELVVAVPTYNNAASAKSRTNANKETYGPGIFYIYTKYPDGVDGMFNITDNPSGASAGAWINPADNVKPVVKPIRKYKVGDYVKFTYIFEKSTTTTKLIPAITQGKITRVIEEDVANPYLIEEGNVGWTNEACITDIVSAPKVEEVKKEEQAVVKEEVKVEEKPVVKEEPKVEEQSTVKENPKTEAIAPEITIKEDNIKIETQPIILETPIVEKDAAWLSKAILEIIKFIINFFSKK